MNAELRNSIWNVFIDYVWTRPNFMSAPYGEAPRMEPFSRELWRDYFKLPNDTRPTSVDEKFRVIRKYFFEAKWYEVYDFIEFMMRTERWMHPKLTNALNHILERENSGYRIIDGCVAEITSEQEIQMLDEMLHDTKFAPVASHLKRALELFASRENPDYRNSIKESISAVESMAKIIADSPKTTLGSALKVLEKDGKMHPSLKEGFQKLYGYASDEDGIRHAMLEEPNLTAADARYFLMSCTSFINYMKAQSA